MRKACAGLRGMYTVFLRKVGPRARRGVVSSGPGNSHGSAVVAGTGQNLQQMRQFYLAWPIRQTLSGKSEAASGSMTALLGQFELSGLAAAFPLSWSHYVRLLSLPDEHARRFYEEEARRGGWSLRQLDRQIGSMFYERTALSRNKAAMLTKGARPKREDAMTPECRGCVDARARWRS